MAEHRRPEIPFSDAQRGSCRWCGRPILYESGPHEGEPNRRRRWHPACVDAYNATDPREARRRVKRRDRGICACCRLDTYELRRKIKGRGRTAKLRARGFIARRSLWELDHVVPLIDGGSHDLSNLQTLCAPCHREKSARESRERAERRASAARQLEGEEVDLLLDRIDELNERVASILDASSQPSSAGAAPSGRAGRS